jgi:hypothetical protein
MALGNRFDQGQTEPHAAVFLRGAGQAVEGLKYALA